MIEPLEALSRPLATQLRGIVEACGAPGAAVAVVSDGGAYVDSFGRRCATDPAPVTPATAFDTGSCSKSYVATALAVLAADGALTLDDPVQRHLPELELDDPQATAQLTVRDLLCNRIGLKRQVPVESFGDLAPLEVMRRVGKLDRAWPFRQGYVYFNPGFIACRLIVERVSGHAYGEFLERRVFAPLGMSGSASGTARVSQLPERACGHARTPEGLVELHEDLFDAWQGAAGVHSCAQDATRWLAFQLGGDPRLAETHRPHTPMPRAECKLIHAPPEAPEVHYCLGWWATTLHGRRLVQHAGEMFGWRAHHALLPDEGIGVSVMLSLGGPRNAAIAYTVLETLLTGSSRDWCEVADAMQARQDASTLRQLAAAFPAGGAASLPLAEYAGEYQHPACGIVEIRASGEGLSMHFRDGRLWTQQLRHLGGHVFETRPRNPAVADYFPVPLRLTFEVEGSRAVALADPQARYRRAGALS